MAELGNITDEDTWGHYGITKNDSELAGQLDPFGAGSASALFAGNFASSSSPLEIFWHDGPANGTTAGEGEASIAIKIRTTALQEAANDYSNHLTYVCTPIF